MTNNTHDNTLICPRMGCNSTNILIFVFDWKLGSPAKTIEIKCLDCEIEVFYDLRLAQNELLDRIDET